MIRFGHRKSLYILISSFLLVFISPHFLVAQSSLSNGWLWPMRLDPRFSATFGELRANHFHAGIDLKTRQREGEPVYSIADGRVIRISVSPYGYGKALYIKHDNGYISVYGHLQRYNYKIDSIVKIEQYKRQNYSVDFALKSDLRVIAGEQIGWSGNSGSSGGPHLHFEIRDSSGNRALNPMQFGYQAADWVRPKIEALKITPKGFSQTVNKEPSAQIFNTEGWGLVYRIGKNDTIRIGGPVEIGVSCVDLLAHEPNRNGVYSIEMSLDSLLFFSVKFDEVAFSQSRYINALTDYAERRLSGKWFVSSKRLPGNLLPFPVYTNQGFITLNPGQFATLRISVLDYTGNKSMLTATLLGDDTLAVQPVYDKPHQQGKSKLVKWNEKFNLRWAAMEISLPKGALYDNYVLTVDSSLRNSRLLSPIYRIGNANIPIHNKGTLSIRYKPYKQSDTSKLVLVRLSDNNSFIAAGRRYLKGKVEAPLNEFGRYALAIDSIAPRLKSLNVNDNSTWLVGDSLKFQVGDDLSGIAQIWVSVNDAWRLYEYDAKNNLVFITVAEALLPGKNRFLIRVTDGCGNSSELSYIVIR